MPKQPNIVMLVNDHQAFYGHPTVRRPQFEKLAAAGAAFTRAYCASPLCCPSRKSMVTGLLPHHHGQLANDKHTPVDSHPTYHAPLADAGYLLRYFGKWHASDGIPSQLGCGGLSWPGYGNPYLTPEYKCYIERNGLPPASMRVEKNLWAHSLLPDVREGDTYSFPRDMVNEALAGIMECPKESHEAFFLVDLACRELETLARQDKPFMLRLDFWGPHQPYYPTREFADMYPPKSIPPYPSLGDDLRDKPASYLFETGTGLQTDNRLIRPNPLPLQDWQLLLSRCYGHISLVDEAGGLLLAKLRELGLWEDTLVLWTADHGDALACHGGHFDKGFYLPEEVMRIPLAISWPGRIAPGQLRQELVCNTDFAPTFAAAAGTAMQAPVDGRSLLDLLDDKPWRQDLVCETHGHLRDWLARILVERRFKSICNAGDIDELYDLENDPYELHNLAGEKEYRPQLKAMQKTLLANCLRSQDTAFIPVISEKMEELS